MIRMKLCLDKFDKDWNHLEHREQWSRSFTRGLLELLYVQAAQLPFTTPLTLVGDIDNVSRSLDAGTNAGGQSLNGIVPALRMNSPGGFSSIYGQGLATGGDLYPENILVSGEHVGIVVGGDNTAVTPIDRRLVQRFSHGRRPADGAPVLFENYGVNDDTDMQVYGANWSAQMFVPSITHRVTSVKVKIYKTGAPGDLTVSIRGAAPTNDFLAGVGPVSGTAPDLASGTILEAAIPGASPGAMTEAIFATPVDLYAGRRYFVVCRALTGVVANRVNWRYDNAGVTYTRAPKWSAANRYFCYKAPSTDSGATWSTNGQEDKCLLFEEYGQSSGEIEYGGTEIVGFAASNPNASFDIKRFFTNRSGENRVIQEVGIQSLGQQNLNTGSSANFGGVHTFLIARDVVGPAVTVLDTEILLVTYTPSITV